MSMDIPVHEQLTGMQIRGRGGILRILGNMISTMDSYKVSYKPKKFDSRNRYYLHDDNVLVDTRGMLEKARALGGKPTHDYKRSRDVLGQQGIHAHGDRKVGPKILKKAAEYSRRYRSANF